MQRVIGLGGIFFKCNHVETTREWYARHLGISLESWGASFFYKNDPNPEAYSNLSFFKATSDYFAPSESPFMINFRVENLDALVEALRAEGVPLIGEPVSEEFGKFAWVMDPEGNKIELWEQPASR
jgi:catechol 2,3-dioxygenase-like lactoylglutathione lyase family enzyme